MVEVPLPAYAEYLWEWYLDLQSPEALTNTELQSWIQVSGNSPTRSEIEVLRKLSRTSNVWWAEHRMKQIRKSGK